MDTLLAADLGPTDGPTNSDLAPFDWDASPADFYFDYVGHCAATVSVTRVAETGHVYDVAIVNRNPETAPQTGHDLAPVRVTCHASVDETPGTHRLDYITGEEPADVRNIRTAAAILISQVADDHTRGFCVWGSHPIPGGLY